MFTMEERDQVRERVLAMARTAAQVTADAFVRSFVRSLDKPELRRALAAATAYIIAALEARDPALCARLQPPLQEFGG